MFNFYQHMKREDQRDPETTGHDRFYEVRPRQGSLKKKKTGQPCRRTQSVAALDVNSLTAANRRNVFRIRSVSNNDKEEMEEGFERAPLVAQKMDSLAKLLFNRSLISSPGSSRSSFSSEQGPLLETSNNGAVIGAAAAALCLEYMSCTDRYEMIAYLKDIGSRHNKHWFVIKDNTTKTERLLTLVPINKRCAIEPTDRHRAVILELFRSIQHPYIHPVLDVAFCSNHLLTVVPFNCSGSLKDLIYKSTWNAEWGAKYGGAGAALPAWQVARVGRQVLEGLLFLREKGFPPFAHLHAGNVILQNGVARISGLENTLVSARPQHQSGETVSLGRLLYEMTVGQEMETDAWTEEMAARLEKSRHVVLVIKRSYGKCVTRCLWLPRKRRQAVLDVLESIFSEQPPSLRELHFTELFRKIDLRELRGSCLPNFSQRLSRSCIVLLEEVTRLSTDLAPPPPRDHSSRPVSPH